MEQTKALALAYEVADALHDRHSIDLHIRFCKRFSEELIRETLQYVLTKPGVKNRARYYTSIMLRYEKNSGY